MEKEFTKGAEAYVVEKSSYDTLAGGRHSKYGKQRGTVKSSGKKYVTVTGCGAPRKFLTTDKPILVSEKGAAFLVSTEERADKLLERLAE